jgi:hypothetical protein
VDEEDVLTERRTDRTLDRGLHAEPIEPTGQGSLAVSFRLRARNTAAESQLFLDESKKSLGGLGGGSIRHEQSLVLCV